MFPIELNQGGNYLIIRLCLTQPRKRQTENWREGKGIERGERGEGGIKGFCDKGSKKTEYRKGRETREQISRNICLSLEGDGFEAINCTAI